MAPMSTSTRVGMSSETPMRAPASSDMAASAANTITLSAMSTIVTRRNRLRSKNPGVFAFIMRFNCSSSMTGRSGASGSFTLYGTEDSLLIRSAESPNQHTITVRVKGGPRASHHVLASTRGAPPCVPRLPCQQPSRTGARRYPSGSASCSGPPGSSQGGQRCRAISMVSSSTNATPSSSSSCRCTRWPPNA